MSRRSSRAVWSADRIRLTEVRRLFVALVLAWLLGEACALTGIMSSPWRSSWLMLQRPIVIGEAAGVGALILALSAKRLGRYTAATLGAALALEAVLFFVRGAAGIDAPMRGFGVGSGLIGLAALAWARLVGRAREKARLTTYLLGALILWGFVLLVNEYLDLTVAMLPRVFDNYAYAVDRSLGLGAEPSWVVGKLFDYFPPLRALCGFVYGYMPVAVAVVFAAELRAAQTANRNVLRTFLLLGVSGFALYFVFPVVGPIDGFGKVWPGIAPPLSEIPDAPSLAYPVPRNCMPSLHTAWALAVLLHSRGLGRPARVLAASWLVLTVLATLGLGFHYAIDLLVAVPFTLAVAASALRVAPPAERARRDVTIAGLAAVAAWFSAIRFGSRWLAGVPFVVVGGAAVTVALMAALWWRLASLVDGADPVDDAQERRRTAGLPVAPLVACFASGFGGFLFVMIAYESLALTLGGSFVGVTWAAVLLCGVAIGAWLGGSRLLLAFSPMRLAATLDVGIAAWLALTPLVFPLVRRAFVAIGGGPGPASSTVTWLRIAESAFAGALPAVLTGMLVPTLARCSDDGVRRLGPAFAAQLAARWLGAALGALVLGYSLLPVLGLTGSALAGCAATLTAGLVRFGVAARHARAAAPLERLPTVPSPVSSSTGLASHRVIVTLLAVLAAVSFAIACVYGDLLVSVAGTSVFVTPLVLFSWLLGLGLGAVAAYADLARARERSLDALALCAGLLGLAVLIGIVWWTGAPSYLASFGPYPRMREFGQRELVRGVVCVIAATPVAACAGAAHCFAIDVVSELAPGNRVARVASASSALAVGAVVGVVGAHFVLIPHLSWLPALRSLAGAYLAVGSALLLIRRTRLSWRPVAIFGAALGSLVLEPSELDFGLLSAGTYIDFSGVVRGPVIAHSETAGAGLTTVIETETPESLHPTVVKNGSPIGDDARSRDGSAEVAAAVVPLFHTLARARALVVGFGTGATSRGLYDAGWKRLDVVDPDEDAVRFADRYLVGQNGGVLRANGVRSIVTDGRSFLLLEPSTYELVAIEVSAVWSAGQGALYSRELYQTVKGRLAPRGVLEQNLPLRHFSPADTLTVLTTARESFEHVTLYVVSGEGIIVACDWDCAPTEATLDLLTNTQALEPELAMLGDVGELRRRRLLDPGQTDALLGRYTASGSYDEFVATEDNLRIECSAPRTCGLDGGLVFARNLAFLRTGQ